MTIKFNRFLCIFPLLMGAAPTIWSAEIASNRKQVEPLSGIEAGKNAIGFEEGCGTRIVSLQIRDVEERVPSFCLDTMITKQIVKVIKHVFVTVENQNKEERVIEFETPQQCRILVNYLTGKLTPRDAAEKIEEVLDISQGQDRWASKIYTFFATYHPGYEDFWSKNLHQVYKNKTLALIAEKLGIGIYKGRRGYTYVKPESPLFQEENKDAVKSVFERFINKCKKKEPDKALYCQFTFDQASLMKLLHLVGFEYYSDWYQTNNLTGDRHPVGQQWVIKNQSTVPPSASFTHASRLGIFDGEGYFLLVQHKNRPGKTFPGGIVERGIDPRQTAEDEVQEEVGIDISNEKVFLLGVLHRTPLMDAYGLKIAADTSFYFACQVAHRNDYSLKLQLSELAWAGWLHWKDALEDQEVGEHVKVYIEKLAKGSMADQEWTYKLPDFHTYYKSPSKEENALLWQKEMVVHLPKMSTLLESTV